MTYQHINSEWRQQLVDVLDNGIESAPRGQKIREFVGAQICFPWIDPIVTVKSREQNFRFAFGEAFWITSGSNRVDVISEFMKGYSRFSDDGVTLRGAYGPKFVEQMSWAVDSLVADNDSRQAVISFWRERPGPSKDIPCTLSQQYLIRDGKLNVVTTMRSNDLAWGFCYDSFTFSMMARVIQIMLAQRGVKVTRGHMTINQGSAHVYEPFWEKAQGWSEDVEIDPRWTAMIETAKDREPSYYAVVFGDEVPEGATYPFFLEALQYFANLASNFKG